MGSFGFCYFFLTNKQWKSPFLFTKEAFALKCPALMDKNYRGRMGKNKNREQVVMPASASFIKEQQVALFCSHFWKYKELRLVGEMVNLSTPASDKSTQYSKSFPSEGV